MQKSDGVAIFITNMCETKILIQVFDYELSANFLKELLVDVHCNGTYLIRIKDVYCNGIGAQEATYPNIR